jgi:transposase
MDRNIHIFFKLEASRNLNYVIGYYSDSKFLENFKAIFPVLGILQDDLERIPDFGTLIYLLEKISEKELEKLQVQIVKYMLRQKVFEKFRLFNKYYAIVFDGTQEMTFSEKHCEHCLRRQIGKDENGSPIYQYYHNILLASLVGANNLSIPILTEFIENEHQDISKQDCELKAFYRITEKLANYFPRTSLCLIADSLYACKPVIKICKKDNWKYIITFKSKSIPNLAKEYKSLLSLSPENKGIHMPNANTRQVFQWVNDIDYEGHLVNVVECEETKSGKKNKRKNKESVTFFRFITNIGVNQYNFKKIIRGANHRISDIFLIKIKEIKKMEAKMEKTKRETKNKKGIREINPNTAGIDLGSRAHYACVPIDRDKENVQRFECFTSDIYKMANWFKKCGIDSVAMESTGVDWIPVYEILEREGFEVKLVNARHVKNVPGRKTDVSDCQWIQELHSYGLLQGSFRPEDKIAGLRGYVRHRDSLNKGASIHIQRIHKALTEMNVQIHKVLSDITGVSGMAIIKAIIGGNHEAKELSKLVTSGVKASAEIIEKSLEGNYRKEHLFRLKQELELYEIYRQKIEVCDEEIRKCYQTFEDKGDINQFKGDKGAKSKNAPNYNLQSELYRMSGVDFTKINGLSVISVQNIIAEVGLDGERWPTEKHFTSWLGLSPNNKITGDKIKSTKTKKVVNRATVAFRQAASTMHHSKSSLGAYYRRMNRRLGGVKAVVATARKIACIYYRMMRFGQDYVDKGMEHYEAQFKDRMIRNLKRQAKNLGFELMGKKEIASVEAI